MVWLLIGLLVRDRGRLELLGAVVVGEIGGGWALGFDPHRSAKIERSTAPTWSFAALLGMRRSKHRGRGNVTALKLDATTSLVVP
jgi:hypothetical protein